MSVVICVEKLQNTVCVSPRQDCNDFERTENHTIGCIANISIPDTLTTTLSSTAHQETGNRRNVIIFGILILSIILAALCIAVYLAFRKHRQQKLIPQNVQMHPIVSNSDEEEDEIFTQKEIAADISDHISSCEV